MKQPLAALRPPFCHAALNSSTRAMDFLTPFDNDLDVRI